MEKPQPIRCWRPRSNHKPLRTPGNCARSNAGRSQQPASLRACGLKFSPLNGWEGRVTIPPSNFGIEEWTVPRCPSGHHRDPGLRELRIRSLPGDFRTQFPTLAMASAVSDLSNCIGVHESGVARILKNAGWLFASNGANTVMQFVQGILVASTLGAEKLGVFALITGFTSIVNQAVDSRVWASAVKFITQYREQGDAARATAVAKLCYGVDAAAGVVACLLVVLTADWAAELFIKDASSGWLIRFYAMSLLISFPVGTGSALLRIRGRFDWLAWQQSGVIAMRLIGTLLLLPLGLDLPGLLAIYLLAGFAGSVTIIAMAWQTAPALGLLSFSQAPLTILRGDWRKIIGFLMSTNLQATGKLLQTHGTTLLLGYLLTPVAVGYYQLASKITAVMTTPLGPLFASSYPEFARLWHRGELAALRRLVFRITMMLSILAALVLAVIWLGGRHIVLFTVGAEFLPAVPILNWLAAGMAIGVATNCAMPLLLAVGRPNLYLIALALAIGGQFLITIVLVPRFGVTAFGMAYVGFYAIWLAVVVPFMKEVLRNAPHA